MTDENINQSSPHLYGGKPPTNVFSVLHDAVVGTEIVVWFDGETGPIGVHMGPETAADLGKRLFDLMYHIE
jgi:hypothetical protein